MFMVIEISKGSWLRCSGCNNMQYRRTVEENLNVCPECDHHFRIDAKTRIEYLVDKDSFQEISNNLESNNPLKWIGYTKRLQTEKIKSRIREAMKIGRAFIKGRAVMLAVMDSNFLMGSMGAVVGEKFCLAVEEAIEKSLPLVAVICSGGARIHEGVVALDQMAKTSVALAKLDECGGLFIPVLTDPTTGGVAASFAMLGDVIIAEPGAMIGFAGPRTIAGTIKIKLPESFQTAEFLLEHGFVDMIVHRQDLRSEISRLIDYCQK